jgi:hypothetical protein
MSENNASTARPQGPRALRILAKSVFRELKSSGYSRSDIVAFATEMLSLVSSDLRDSGAEESSAIPAAELAAE